MHDTAHVVRKSVRFGQSSLHFRYAVFSGATAGGRPDRRLSHWEAWTRPPLCYGALLAAAGLVFVSLFGNAGWALVGFACAGAGLATIIPNTFAARAGSQSQFAQAAEDLRCYAGLTADVAASDAAKSPVRPLLLGGRLAAPGSPKL